MASYLDTDHFKKFCTEISKIFNRHTTQLGGLYFAKNGSGQWGYKTSQNGGVTPF